MRHQVFWLWLSFRDNWIHYPLIISFIDLLISFQLFKLFALTLRLIDNSNLCCLSNWLEFLYISRFLLYGFISIYFSNFYNENDVFSSLCQSAASLFNYGYVVRCFARVMVIIFKLNFWTAKYLLVNMNMDQYCCIMWTKYVNSEIQQGYLNIQLY